ncbi:uncharacterized protein LAESUDRAFT_812126 [Laetiporus sulphureus 93-53]|uniref:Transmembrane protein n=1 Tax=Laetiporus sulphureus 93-53 TaxID=1314785 RepID=A0A165EPL8_9APHY|nr:uncharacterized protein LAESUDRAFT_812126 [Laetiporus sulphureus 93-53]KZT07501.1 hypothetical protein LAESUDRAFT_812126 [Laetiporus sulphureus 93-53]
MKVLSAILFLLNVVLFFLFNLFTICRDPFWPEIWSKMLRHPVQSLFLGTYPMGLATILNIAAALISTEYKFGGNAFLYSTPPAAAVRPVRSGNHTGTFLPPVHSRPNTAPRIVAIRNSSMRLEVLRSVFSGIGRFVD